MNLSNTNQEEIKSAKKILTEYENKPNFMGYAVSRSPLIPFFTIYCAIYQSDPEPEPFVPVLGGKISIKIVFLPTVVNCYLDTISELKQLIDFNSGSIHIYRPTTQNIASNLSLIK